MSSEPNSDSPSFFTTEQWSTFYALTEAIVPAVSALDLNARVDLSPDTLSAFANSSATADNPLFRDGIEKMFIKRLPTSSRKGIATILSMLNSTAGSLLLTYSSTLFQHQPLEERERILRSWLDRSAVVFFPPIRTFAFSIVQLVKATWLKTNANVLYPAIGYDAPVGSADIQAKAAMQNGEEAFYRFEFMEFSNQENIEYDAVIVGSGCGGAVVAARLAEAGHRVIVVEKANWIPTDQLPLAEGEAAEKMFENGLSVVTTNNQVTVLAGSTFGGGGTINWCASLETQGFVREEWAQKHNLPFFLSADFQSYIDRVCERMGVTREVQHNHRNKTLIEGARKLGYHTMTVPQNASGSGHSCGSCHNGCGGAPGARKMGTTQTYLPDAARAGAKFVQTFHCRRVLFSDDSHSQAIGITGTWGENKIPITIKAKQVIVSAGSLNSPALLMRSGLTNPNIGQNLHLHPVIPINAIFPQPTSPMKGSLLTSVCTSFENLDQQGHGVKLETMVMLPFYCLTPMPWHSAREWKQAILSYPHLGTFIPILREKHPGCVKIDNDGNYSLEYDVSKEDRGMLLQGIEALAKILFLQGAEEILVPVAGVPPFRRRQPPVSPNPSEEMLLGYSEEDLEGNDDELEVIDLGILDHSFQRWLRVLRANGLPSPGTMFNSAHQMGSCKMSRLERDGVVDWSGKVWGTKGLWVADASVLPSASGANPMVTTMALAEWIADKVKEEMAKGS